MAPIELHREAAVWRERRRDEHDRDVVQAWHAVAIYLKAMASGRLAGVKEWLAPRGVSSSQQTTGQMKSTLAILSAQYGYPVKWGES